MDRNLAGDLACARALSSESVSGALAGVHGMRVAEHSPHDVLQETVRETKSTCCYCGVGCGVLIESERERIISVRGDPVHPANFGRLCTKGQTLHLSAHHGTRALFPELRGDRSAPRRRVPWDEALDHAAARFAATIRAHGPDSVAFYISGQLLTEDYYVFNKLAKGLVGTNNVDTNSRLCMSSAVAGYKATLGADAPPACYEDIDHAQCLLIAGSNTAVAHPVLYRRIEAARVANPALKLVVVDPRRTDTAADSHLHLAIAPGTDIALFNAMLHVMLDEGLVDRGYIERHTEGFAALEKTARGCRPADAAAICGVQAQDIVTAARWFGQSRASLSLYCQGLNQSTHGTHNNAALVNLHLATGQIGKPGAGPFSLTGQPNAMGGREVGGMANLLSAHRDLDNPAHRAEIARLWRVADVPAKPGKTAVELFQALRDGEIRAVWIACTNPAQSMPDLRLVHEALARAEFVVLQEAYRNTETAAYADLLLPASSWGEKEGTVTNSERRISRVRAAVPPPGEARHDWEIAVDFAKRLGASLENPSAQRLFPYSKPEHIFDEHRETTRGRDLDITGLSYALLESRGPQQWPFPAGATSGRARLYADGVFPTADGRARFVDTKHQPAWEATGAAYPLRLNTGRLRDQWHGMSRTGTVARLFSHVPEPALSMHPEDMAARGIVDGDGVRVSSARGELLLRAEASPEQRRGDVYIPMHWGSRFMSGAGSNTLTVSAFDPISKQPELKHAAVQVERVELPHELVVLRRIGADGWERVQRLQSMLPRFPLAALSPFGRESPCVMLRARGSAAFELAELDRVIDEPGLRSVSYEDPARGIAKRIWIDAEGRIAGVRLSGETGAAAWLKEQMQNGALVPPALALAPRPAGSAAVPRGRIVCNCFDVSETEVRAAVGRGADLPALQRTLKCGTHCGSCAPELRRLYAGLNSLSAAA
jgi:assimilatory nitrate reductase catalytic subunit